MIFRFFLLAYGITWGALLPFLFLDAADRYAVPFLGVMLLLARFGPSLAGLAGAAAENGGRGVSDLLHRLTPRLRDTGWLAFALFVPMAVAVTTTRLIVADGTPPGPVEAPHASGVLALLAWKLLLGSGLGEELGWRGFALPRLQRALHPLAATVVLGLAWAVWQWPASGMLAADRAGASFAWLAVTVLALAAVFTWLYNRTGGNLLACVLLHASVNATREVFEHAVPLLWTNGMADATLAGVWGTLALLLIATTRGRLGHREERAPG